MSVRSLCLHHTEAVDAWPCRTNFDCDNLESFLTGLGGGGKFRGKMEKGVENSYSCLVLAGARSMDQRRDALQV